MTPEPHEYSKPVEAFSYKLRKIRECYAVLIIVVNPRPPEIFYRLWEYYCVKIYSRCFLPGVKLLGFNRKTLFKKLVITTHNAK